MPSSRTWLHGDGLRFCAALLQDQIFFGIITSTATRLDLVCNFLWYNYSIYSSSPQPLSCKNFCMHVTEFKKLASCPEEMK